MIPEKRSDTTIFAAKFDLLGNSTKLKTSFSDSFCLKMSTLFYIPTFSSEPLFTRVTLPSAFPSDIPFTHSAYIKYSLWYTPGGDRFANCDKAALAYQDENLKVELG